MQETLTRSDSPITVNDAKDHLRVRSSAENPVLSGFIATSIGWAEEVLNRVIGEATVALKTNYATKIRLRSPAKTITSVKYDGASGEVTVNSATYKIIEENEIPYLVFSSAPDITGLSITKVCELELTITYSCGFSSEDLTKPEYAGIKTAVLLKTGTFYEVREDSQQKAISTALMMLQSKRLRLV